MTAVRVLYIAALIAIGYGGSRALDYHEPGHFVSGLVIAAIGMGVLILAAFRYRRMPPEERRPISGESRLAGAIGLVIAAALATFGALAVWVMFTPDGGLKTLPIVALFFGMAVWSLAASRQKFRASRHGSIRAQPGRPAGFSS
jgi:FtsH-binding integral membrane protein